MTTISNLIKELKITNITHTRLEDLCILKTGDLVVKSECDSGKIPVISGGKLPMGYVNRYNFDGENITVARCGGAGFVDWHEGKIWVNDKCIILTNLNRNLILPKYLYYFLFSIQPKIYSLSSNGGSPTISYKNLYNLDIYFPSLPYQQQIVKILDEFTELEAELEARKIQYKFWQQYLLNDKNWETTNILHIKLKDLFNYRNGYTPLTSNSNFWNNGAIPWFRIDDIRNFGSILYDASKHITPLAVKGNNYIEPDSIIVATTATIGVHALIKVKSLCNQRFTILTIKDEYRKKIDMKFIYYYCYLLDKFCIEHQNASTFNSVDMLEFENFIFNIPPLEYQNKIVWILDQFNDLTTNLQDGIPAEIKLRKEQYQYYLKQLLDFNNQTK